MSWISNILIHLDGSDEEIKKFYLNHIKDKKLELETIIPLPDPDKYPELHPDKYPDKYDLNLAVTYWHLEDWQSQNWNCRFCSTEELGFNFIKLRTNHGYLEPITQKLIELYQNIIFTVVISDEEDLMQIKRNNKEICEMYVFPNDFEDFLKFANEVKKLDISVQNFVKKYLDEWKFQYEYGKDKNLKDYL